MGPLNHLGHDGVTALIEHYLTLADHLCDGADHQQAGEVHLPR